MLTLKIRALQNLSTITVNIDDVGYRVLLATGEETSIVHKMVFDSK